MALPIINIEGYTVGYNGDDFVKNIYSIKKSFEANGLKYEFLYRGVNKPIFVTVRNKFKYKRIAVSYELLENKKVFSDLLLLHGNL